MEAKPGSQPSYIWKSILAARHLLEKDTCWRVGNEGMFTYEMINGSLGLIIIGSKVLSKS